MGTQGGPAETKEGNDFCGRELREGSSNRDPPLPERATEADVRATYTDGILEDRVAMPKAEATRAETKKVPLTKALRAVRGGETRHPG